VLDKRPAPEFEQWLTRMQIFQDGEGKVPSDGLPEAFRKSLASLPGGVGS
jgi:ethanolamine ammonia-lyase large subunit